MLVKILPLPTNHCYRYLVRIYKLQVFAVILKYYIIAKWIIACIEPIPVVLITLDENHLHRLQASRLEKRGILLHYFVRSIKAGARICTDFKNGKKYNLP